MKDWKRILIKPDASIIEAIEIIDNGSLQIALVVDSDNRLLGTVTDGDVRRGLLKRIDINEEPVTLIMNAKPTVARSNENREAIFALMKAKDLGQMPIVDEQGRVISLETLHSYEPDNWVVIMAGGIGSRLSPLTQDNPKPMLHVGDRPILETILLNFAEQGFRKFYIAVNYKAEKIEDYFGDGAKWGVTIKYLREKERLGTAGSLSLIPERPQLPLLVMNGDLLTKVNFRQLLDFHQEHRAVATMCVREYRIQLPYGVVQLDKHRLTGITEKPVHNFFVSAGVYVFEPDALGYVPADAYLDMPSLFEKLIAGQKETAVFPLREYWIDIGRMGDFKRAEGEFYEVFK